MPDPSDPSDSTGSRAPTDSGDAADLVDRVERRLSAEHADVLDGLAACADAVAAEWDGARKESPSQPSPRTTDRDAVVPAFRRALDAAGLLAHLPRVLSDLVTAAGRPMPAPPVAAPPYVVVTSEGVVLRASLGDGRLVVTLRVFGVDRREGASGAKENGYVRRDGIDVVVEFR